MQGAFLILKKELIEFFKDRRTVFFTFVMPLVLYPVLLTMMAKLAIREAGEREGKPSRIVLLDPSGALRGRLEADPAKFQIVPRPDGDFLQAVTAEKVDLQVEVDPGAADAKARMETFRVSALFDESTGTSRTALKRLKEALKDYDEAEVKGRLSSLKAPELLAKPTRLESKDAGDISRQMRKMLGSFLPYVLLIVMFAGAMQHGAYMSAGERERGTLLSLLATRVPRIQIILGKQLALFTLSLLTVVVSLASMAFGIGRMGREFQVAEAAEAAARGGAAAAAGSLSGLVTPSTFLLTFLLLVPLGFFFTAIVMLVGTQAKTTREAQTALTPGIFIVIVLGVFSMAPGIEKMAFLPYVPILNISLAIRKLFSQQANAFEYGVALAMTVALAALMTWQSSRVLGRESSLFKGGD
ncbi:MAG: ABC transporter permease [Holophagaceae bacterium]